MFGNFYNHRRVLITGHSGFKGSWLSIWLSELGAEVHGFSLENTQPFSLYQTIPKSVWKSETFGDVASSECLSECIEQSDPEVVFHLAAQSLVRQSYLDPLETFRVNVLGTATVLNNFRKKKTPTTIVVATSDKCYENLGWEFGYRENDVLGGVDPYSASKAAAEIVVGSWRRAFFEPGAGFCQIATARAGNVIGGGDYSADRLIPDCVRSQISNTPLLVRNPQSVRPWQHVLDCLSGYIWLGACLAQGKSKVISAGAFNFGPPPESHRTVAGLLKCWYESWPGTWKHQEAVSSGKEAKFLTLSIERARELLNWSPTWTFEQAIHETAFWYRSRHVDRYPDVAGLCVDQIKRFMEESKKRNASWSTTQTISRE